MQARHGSRTLHRALLQAGITRVASAPELQAALQAGSQHIRIVDHITTGATPGPSGWVVNGTTESIVVRILTSACHTAAAPSAAPVAFLKPCIRPPGH